MPTSDYGQYVTASTVETASTGALSGDGSAGDKLAVSVDGTTIDVSAGNALEVIAGANTQVLFNDAGVAAGNAGLTFTKASGDLTAGGAVKGGGGFVASDDSTGTDAAVTTGGLVGKTMTFKDGLLVDFA